MPKPLVIALALATLVGCPASADDSTPAEHGPADAMLTFDAAQIPLPSPNDGALDGTAPPTLDAADSGAAGWDTAADQRCVGTPTPCSSLSTSTCLSTQGCRTSGTCTGVSSLCSWQTSSYSCGALQGCYWSYSSSSCSGFSWACFDFSKSSSCIYQKGCSWKSNCEGVATPCSLLSEYTCTTQPGCSWL